MPKLPTKKPVTDHQQLELIRSLSEHPYHFDFFQAVRLLTRGASHSTSDHSTSDKENLARPVSVRFLPTAFRQRKLFLLYRLIHSPNRPSLK